MKIMIIGSGGRESAIAWKIAQSSKVQRIYCVPGNGGTYLEDKCKNVKLESISEMADFAQENSVDLTVVGPEAPLSQGIADVFKKRNLSIFGPLQKGALLESSKVYSKNFMKKYGVKTAAYETFDDYDEALKYLKKCSYPAVIKADGLAAGKGVTICQSFKEAEAAVSDFMVKDIFKGSGKKIIIEEFIEGVEASILSVCDGNTIMPFISAKDHKQIYEGGLGPNTGGMGAIAPNPYCTPDVLKQFTKDIMNPTLRGIKEENIDYKGIIFFGIMISKKGVYLLEYNVRMGDPETQAVLPLMKTDFTDLISAALKKKLDDFKIEWNDGCCCSVVAASKGYPGSYNTGYEIKGTKDADGKVFIAGADYNGERLVTCGGRVLCVSCLGNTLEKAREKAYESLGKINFEGMYYRKDIGKVY